MTNKTTDLCALVRELLPLYADGVLEEQASLQVQQHLADCPACRRVLEDAGGELPPLPTPSAEGEKRLFARLRRTRLSAYWLLGLLVWPTCMGLMLLTSGLVSTVPWLFLGAFVLTLLGAGWAQLAGGAAAATVLFSFVQLELVPGWFVLPWTAGCLVFGRLAGRWVLRRGWRRWAGALAIAAGVGVCFSFSGTPWGMLAFQNTITEYVQQKYGDRVVLHAPRYDWLKTGSFSMAAHSADDSSATVTTYFNLNKDGTVWDDYSFRVGLTLEQQVEEILEGMLRAVTGRTDWHDLYLTAYIDADTAQLEQLPLNAVYDGSFPVAVEVSWQGPEDGFASAESFAEALWPVVDQLQQSGLPVEKSRVYSFEPDGNTLWLADLELPVDSAADLAAAASRGPAPETGYQPWLE